MLSLVSPIIKISGPSFCEIVSESEPKKYCPSQSNAEFLKRALIERLLNAVNEYVEDNIALVHIYVEDPLSSMAILKRDMDETQSEFVGNIGGLMSLAMGASFITRFDVTYMALRVLQENLKRFCKYRACFQSHKRVKNYTSG